MIKSWPTAAVLMTVVLVLGATVLAGPSLGLDPDTLSGMLTAEGTLGAIVVAWMRGLGQGPGMQEPRRRPGMQDPRRAPPPKDVPPPTIHGAPVGPYTPQTSHSPPRSAPSPARAGHGGSLVEPSTPPPDPPADPPTRTGGES